MHEVRNAVTGHTSTMTQVSWFAGRLREASA